jgi:fibronectin-binding autotransporter adhesin
MKARNILISLLFLIGLIILSSPAMFAQTRYLNSTDGDDAYDGTSPTHDSPTIGPKRTLTGSFTAFASGTVVSMTAGSYIYDQSGIGGGNDAGGYTLGTGANKSMTFIITTYLTNKVALLSTGGLTIDCGTGTIKFQAQTAGEQSVSLDPGAPATVLLKSGTLDVSGITFNVGTLAGTSLGNPVERKGGSVVGTLTYAADPCILYDGSTSKNAGGEVPAKVMAITISSTGGTVTFPNAVTFGTTGFGLTNTTATSSATFSGLVTLTSAVTTATATIVNSQNTSTATWTFAGGITVNSTIAANGTVIDNHGTGKILVTGPVTFVQNDVTGTNDGPNTSTIQNFAIGTLGLTGGVIETPTASGTGSKFTAVYTSVVNFINNATGTANIGGGASTTFTGTFTTAAAAGTVTLTGPVTVTGAFTNGAGHTVALTTYNLTFNGVGAGGLVANSGNITSAGIGSGTVIFAHITNPVTDASAGTWPNIKKTSGQALTLTTSATLNGSVENAGAGLLSLTGPTSIMGNVTVSGTGGITLNTGGTISGNISVASGTLTTAANTVTGTTTLTSGGIILGGNVTLMGAYTQGGGNLDFGTSGYILDVKNNFTRNAGTVTPGDGTLQFSAGGAQTFSGGSNLEVYNLSVNGVGTGVTFVSGSLMVDNNATIVSNTNVILGDLNIRMQGTGGATPTFSNAGQYTSTGGGGIIFEGPAVGNQYSITGNGVNSNIEVRLAVETGTVQVPAGQIVTWSGLLTLTRGTIDAWGAGSQFNPSTLLTTPTVQRNLGDQDINGTADGYPIATSGGTFNSTHVNYNLTYYNLAAMVPGGSAVGPEFVIGATPRVVNLTINAIGAPVLLPVAGLYKFSGNLKIANSAELKLQGVSGADDLVSTGSAVNDTIKGLLSRTGTAAFILAGDGNIVGGTATAAPADASTIASIDVNTVTTSATYNITNLKVIGVAGADGITVDAGTVNLGMLTYGTTPTIGTVRNITVNAGTLSLTANAALQVALNITGGTIDFNNSNLYASVAAATVTATGGAFAATGATTGGYLVCTAADNLNTGTILIPRVRIASGSTLTLTGNSGVSDIFEDYDASATTPVAGTLALGANTFVMGGGTWNAMGTYTGATSKVQITGATNVNLKNSISVPNIEVINTTNTATLVDNDGSATTVPDLTISGVLTMTSGTLNMQNVDILLTLTGSDALVYTNGTINATTGAAVPLVDNATGELSFTAGAGQSFSISSTNALTIPNLTIAAATPLTYTGGAVAAAPTFTVSKYLKEGASIVMGAAGEMVLGNKAWIEISAGTMDFVPAIGDTINYFYNGLGTTGKELTTSTTKIQKFYVNAGPLTLNAATQVNGELRLIASDLVTTATKTMTMGANSLVTRVNGTINVAATTDANLLGGPIDLTYLNTAATTTLDGEFPSAMSVNTLSVKTNITAASTSPAAAPLALHASRTVKDLVLETDQTAAPGTTQNGTQFDLNGFTLTVSNATSATLTRGALVSYKATGGTYVYGTLAVAGALTQTANASIKNVIVTAATATLAGTFGTQDYDGVGVGNALPGALPTMTVTGNASVAGFNGDLTVGGNTTINGAYAGGTLTVGGNVTVATGGSMNTATNLVFIGSTKAILTVPTAGATVGSVTFNKTTGKIDTIALAGGSLAATGTVNFTSGLFFVPDPLIFNIPAPLLGGGQGFTHNVAVTDLSHVVGLVSKTLRNTTGFLAGATEAISLFPTGTTGVYRPVTLTFAPQFGVPTMPNATVVISHVDLSPGGSQALPIVNGVDAGINISRYPSFYWRIFTIGNIDQSVVFDLALTAGNFTDYDSPANVRIIRRHGAVSDINNDWLLQGEVSGYDNEVNQITGFTAINKNSVGGLRTGGAIFTLGMKSKIVPPVFQPVTIYKVNGVYSPNPFKLALAGKFTNGVGALTYSATSTNTTVAKDTVVSDTLRVTLLKDGSATITVKATDANKDFVTSSFDITVKSTGVVIAELPTVFALQQNYPNPFNPTTNISFDIPQNSSVKIVIYDMLGREVSTLVNANYAPGRYTVPFNASKLSSGIYIYRMTSQSSSDQKMFTSTKKLMLVK